jgi:hypothetical protein
MFSKTVFALNDSPKSQLELCAAIDLARACNAEIGTMSDPVRQVTAAPAETQ